MKALKKSLIMLGITGSLMFGGCPLDNVGRAFYDAGVNGATDWFRDTTFNLLSGTVNTTG